MRNKVHSITESRTHGDVYVRFGGRFGETCGSNAARRSGPSLQMKGLTVLACHQFTPLKLHNGKLWLALCSITPASHPAPGRVFLRNSRHPATSQYYSFKEKAWSDFAPFHISPTEMQVILCHLKGMNIGDTAREISRTTYAVKKIRKALLNKSGVDNFTSFCQLALLHQQI